VGKAIDGVNHYAGFSAAPNVHYHPDPALQATFASYPPLPSPAAQALGFAHDGSLEQLIKRTLEPESEDLPAL
jgi:hypothetical protein